MGLPVATLKSTWYGNLSQAGTWSVSMWFQLGAAAAVPTSAQVGTALVDLQGTDQGITDAFKILNMPSTTCLGQKGYYFPAGSDKATVVGQNVYGTAIAGTGGTDQPHALAVVASLRSNTSGRSGRGRIYFPCTSSPAYTTGGQLTSTTALAVCQQVRDFIHQLNLTDFSGTWEKGLTPIVASFTKGQAYPIATVIVDSLVDTQHRREDKQNPSTISTLAV